MDITTGHFNLFPIFGFAANNPVMPNPSDRPLQAEYSTLIKSILTDIPSLPGWYLWGKFNDMGWWETVYLGKAGKKKTSSLHTRLYDELREECIAFWAEVYGREPMVGQHMKFPGYEKYGSPTRSLRKSGARIVIWVSADPISEEEIKRQEDLLIKAYRPTHNSARWNQREKHDDLTESIENAIEAKLMNIVRAR
jgi:hypothetical protein